MTKFDLYTLHILKQLIFFFTSVSISHSFIVTDELVDMLKDKENVVLCEYKELVDLELSILQSFDFSVMICRFGEIVSFQKDLFNDRFETKNHFKYFTFTFLINELTSLFILRLFNIIILKEHYSSKMESEAKSMKCFLENPWNIHATLKIKSLVMN
ncbi:hypothetical protein BpHYR1_020607 [Brachionus plicatilis]|uniref:Uncharacterized protein n=1 Tax=Brachionus plicatilis TaxID=10195 RepID=A0A3M7PQN4_BRAPC|nr:hypothetical protein BpHYR1_020607 [Brachionus plicatilis]